MSSKIVLMPRIDRVSTFERKYTYINTYIQHGETQEGSLKLCIKLHVHDFIECIMSIFNDYFFSLALSMNIKKMERNRFDETKIIIAICITHNFNDNEYEINEIDD